MSIAWVSGQRDSMATVSHMCTINIVARPYPFPTSSTSEEKPTVTKQHELHSNRIDRLCALRYGRRV